MWGVHDPVLMGCNKFGSMTCHVSWTLDIILLLQLIL